MMMNRLLFGSYDLPGGNLFIDNDEQQRCSSKSQVNIRKIDFPWGLMPWLRLGQVFQMGQPVWNEAEGKIFKLVIPDSSTGTLARAGAIPALANYLLQGEDNLAEYCIRFQTEQTVSILIPVLE